jgi:hypothetical protein
MQTAIEQFQEDHQNSILIDCKFIYLNKCIKYLLNFVVLYFILIFILSNYKNLTIIQLVLLFCAISSVLFYILDLYFPTCII